MRGEGGPDTGGEGADTVASTGHLVVALAAFRYDKSIVDNQ